MSSERSALWIKRFLPWWHLYADTGYNGGTMPLRERFVVEGLAGRKTLKGEIPVRGAKNAVLKALPASVLFVDKVILDNVPRIEDVERMNELVRSCGGAVEMHEHTIEIEPPEHWSSILEPSIAERV